MPLVTPSPQPLTPRPASGRSLRGLCISLLVLGVAPSVPAAEVALAPTWAEPGPSAGGIDMALAVNEASWLTASRGLWLGVSGGVSGSSSQSRRAFGLVELGIGFDALVGGGNALAAPSDDPELELEPQKQAAEVATDSVRAPTRQPTRGCSEVGSCVPPATAQLARATVAAALRVQGGAGELSRLDRMASRTRSAASLPEVRLGAGTSRDESLRLTPTVNDPARFTRDGGRDLWVEARLIWRLDGAIFSKDEIAIARLQAQQREETARLTRDVLDALIAWQRARVALASELSSDEERDAAIIAQYGALARLDVLTDGWFSRALERREEAAGAGADKSSSP